jgi:NADH-quinone oxidoreductase subunit M
MFCASGMVFGGTYSLWLLNRLLFGNIKSYALTEFYDLTRLEFYYLLPFAFITILLGIYPELLICYINII